MSTKECSGFLFCLDLELFMKMLKQVCRNQVNSKQRTRSKQNKSLEHPFVGIGKWEASAKFEQKILNSMVVGARQSFKFYR